jgi:hypothetical protein
LLSTRSDCSADMRPMLRRQRVEPVVEDAEVDELAQLADRARAASTSRLRASWQHAQRREAAERRSAGA